MATCPNQHESQATDYCQVCGIEMAPGKAGSGNAPHSSTVKETHCPTCQAKRSDDDGDFCEVCGYNFKTGVCGVPFAPPPAPAPEPPASTPLAPRPEEPALASGQAVPEAVSEQPAMPRDTTRRQPRQQTWLLVSSVDLSLTGVAEADGPADRTERVFPLDLADQLIGRRSVRRSVQPEIPLDGDDGISHRHAKILRQPDGTFAVLDLGSSNGSFLNGTELKPNVLTALQESDRIGLGRWTCLTVKKQALNPEPESPEDAEQIHPASP